MSNEIGAILAKLNADDIELDRYGRVVVKNADIANAIRQLSAADLGKALADNYGCCKNGIACSAALQDLQDAVEAKD